MKMVLVCMSVTVLSFVLLGCVSWKSTSPTVSLFERTLTGENSIFMPDSDGQYQKEATNSAQVDNLNDLQKLATSLLESGVDPSAVLALANGDAEALRELMDNDTITPEQLREAQRFLATVAITKGLVNINNNSAGVDRAISADVTAAITEALRAAVTATQRESTAYDNQPNASGTGAEIPINVTTPIP